MHLVGSRVAAVVFAVVLAGGCTDGGSQARPTSSARPTATPSTAATVTGPPSTAATPSATTSRSSTITAVPAAYRGEFSTPSGNVACEIGTDFVWCAALVQPWEPIPREAGCARDWRTTIMLRAESGATLRGDCGYGPETGGPPLAYGRGIQVGRTRCVSERTGLHCLVFGTTRGFFVSRGAYRLSATRSPLTTAPAPAPVTDPVVVLPAGFHGGFRTDDMVCDVDDASAHCLLYGATWKAPPAAEPCVDGDESTEVRVGDSDRGTAFRDCRTDSLSGGDVLPPGRGLRVGDVECLVKSTEVRCTNHGTGHGFSVSRERFGGF